jgi:hypothetical protein
MNDQTDIPYLTHLKGRLVESIDRRTGRGAPAQLGRLRLAAVVTAGVLVIAGMVAAGVSWVGRAPIGHKVASGYGNDVRGDGQPCAGHGSLVTLDDAAKTEPYQVLVPNDPLASTGSLLEIWKCTGNAVELRFKSGIHVLLDLNDIANPAAAWRAEAAQDEDLASVGIALNEPALLIDPARDPSGSATGSVTFVHGATWVVIEGNGSISLPNLVRVADSMEVSS